MARKVMSKQELLDRREEILEAYSKPRSKSRRLAVLTKKERKILGLGRDCGKAIAKNVRISSSKVNIVIRLIKGKQIDEAIAILKYTSKAASPVLLKLLKSAEANAVNNNDLNRDLLYVAECYAGEGPTMKRIIPRGKGSANRILKRTSHITMVLKEEAEGEK